MASQNAETFRELHQAFNRRDFDGVVSKMAEGFTYRDQARNVTFTGRDGFKEFMEGWAGAFSNATVTDPSYLDAGDTVIAQFMARGVNDGPLGPLPATGREIDVPFCELMRFDDDGQIVSGGIYYDQLTMMIQLGHSEPSAEAASG
jgi:steroid delta-isomerase-like uncharacterized protein